LSIRGGAGRPFIAVSMTHSLLHSIKLEIWNHPKIRRDAILLQVAADKARIRLPINTVEQAQALLASLASKPKPKVKLPNSIKARYIAAHEAWFSRTHPNAYRDGYYTVPTIPNTATANGLTSFVQNYLDWTGSYANRVNTTGRRITVNGREKWIKGTTKKGTADIAAVIRGRHVSFEIKVGKDTPSDKQLLRQQQIRAAGGEYFFTHTAEEFFEQLESLI
jgi:hypothetical protein